MIVCKKEFRIKSYVVGLNHKHEEYDDWSYMTDLDGIQRVFRTIKIGDILNEEKFSMHYMVSGITKDTNIPFQYKFKLSTIDEHFTSLEKYRDSVINKII